MIFSAMFSMTWAAILGIKIVSFSRKRHENGDVAIVLGNAIRNGLPGPVFRERINHAITLFKEKKVKAIIITGGPVTGEKLTEAEAGRNYAVLKGIPQDSILVENKSRDTWQNLVFTAEIIKKLNFQKALVVSDPLHMRRAMSMVRDLKIPAEPCPTPTSLIRRPHRFFPFLVREIGSHVFYLAGRKLHRRQLS